MVGIGFVSSVQRQPRVTIRYGPGIQQTDLYYWHMSIHEKNNLSFLFFQFLYLSKVSDYMDDIYKAP